MQASPHTAAIGPRRQDGAFAAAMPPAGRDASSAGQRIADSLQCLQTALSPKRRIVHAGDVLYRQGDRFEHLHVLNSGCFKLLSPTADGRELVVGLKFRGDWLGFGAIAKGSYACEAVAMDMGEVWTLRYDALLRACAAQPRLMAIVHEAMSGEIMRDREAVTALCTLPADARVATFLHQWAESLAERGMRTDQISLRLTRAEIGNYLGLTLETVSRVLSRLARARLITFREKSRRDLCIPDFQALAAFIGGPASSIGLH